MRFNAGDTVEILPHASWPRGGQGTVAVPPGCVACKMDGNRAPDSPQRTLRRENRIITNVWVKFEGKLEDAHGRTYNCSEIEFQFLRAAS